jgi:hypothetical protein
LPIPADLDFLTPLLLRFVQLQVVLERGFVGESAIALLTREVRALVDDLVLGKKIARLEKLPATELLALESLPILAVLELVLLELVVILHLLVAELAF